MMIACCLRNRSRQGRCRVGRLKVLSAEVFFDGESGVAPFQIAGAIVLDAVAQGQVLSARGRGSDQPARNPAYGWRGAKSSG